MQRKNGPETARFLFDEHVALASRQFLLAHRLHDLVNPLEGDAVLPRQLAMVRPGEVIENLAITLGELVRQAQ